MQGINYCPCKNKTETMLFGTAKRLQLSPKQLELYFDQTKINVTETYFEDLSCGSRSSHPDVFLGKVVLKIFSKITGEHPCRSAIPIKLQSNFIGITLRHGYSPVHLLYIFRTPFPKNTSGWLLLDPQLKSQRKLR